MLRIEDVADKTFTASRSREGYESAEVDEFRTEVLEALTLREKVIGELQEQLATARTNRADADADGDQDGQGADRRESSIFAARLLEMATVNADELVADAQAEADALVSAARNEAEQLVTASRTEAERVTAELARHKDEQTAELDQHRAKVLAEVADKKSALEAKVEKLRQQEGEHRNRLRAHFAEQLAQLDDNPPAVLRAVAAD